MSGGLVGLAEKIYKATAQKLAGRTAQYFANRLA